MQRAEMNPDCDITAADDWDDQVAPVLSLVVENCPAATRDPPDLCSLLSVSTVCRTALQEQSKGDCCIALSGETPQLRSINAWLCAGNSALVATLILPGSCPLPDSTMDGSLLAVLAHHLCGKRVWETQVVDVLSKLKHLKALSWAIDPRSASIGVFHEMPLSFLRGLSNMQSLTAVDLAGLQPGDVDSLPVSISTAKLTFRDFDNHPDVALLDVSKLRNLSSLHVKVRRRLQPRDSDTSDGVELNPSIAEVQLPVTGQLTRLVLDGDGLSVRNSRQGLITVRECVLMLLDFDRRPPAPLDSLAGLICSMPKLVDLHLCDVMGSFARRDGFDRVATAAGSATALTSLCVKAVGAERIMLSQGGLAAAVQQLGRLERLELGVRLSDVAHDVRYVALQQDVVQSIDTAPLARLSTVTALILNDCSNIPGQGVVSLCSSMPQLQEICLSGHCAWSCRDVFLAVAKLTNLTVLSFLHNSMCLRHSHGMRLVEHLPAYLRQSMTLGHYRDSHDQNLHLLAPLRGLVELTLPAG